MNRTNTLISDAELARLYTVGGGMDSRTDGLRYVAEQVIVQWIAAGKGDMLTMLVSAPLPQMTLADAASLTKYAAYLGLGTQFNLIVDTHLPPGTIVVVDRDGEEKLTFHLSP